MNHIGKIIQEYRIRLGISRRELSQGICTEKYIYFIEKGERTPSMDMSRVLGNRLGIDLIHYYEYFGCASPLGVYDYITKFQKYRRSSEIGHILFLYYFDNIN